MKTKMRILSLLFFMAFYGQMMAQGDLLLFPKRLEFEGTTGKFQNITLLNVAKKTVTYTISFVEIKMGEDGSFTSVEVPEEGQNFASPFLRCYPRTVTLDSNESQTIKVQLTKTNEMKLGEYRSHIYFRALPKTEDLAPDTPKVEDKGMSVKLTAIYGITIPVIITVGDVTAEVTLDKLKIETLEDKPYLAINFNRKGNGSTYGDIRVNHISPAGIKTEVASTDGFAVYTPRLLRKASIKLNTDKEVNYKEGKLEITYAKQDKSKVFAEAVLNLK
jgi:hypothetical protein